MYYKDEKIYLQEYEQRFQSLFTKHFDFEIKQFNHKYAYPAFLCYTEELVVLLEKIYAENQKLLVLLNKTPDVVLKQFCLLCIIDEVKASNDIEGNHSTRRELREAMENISNKNRFVSTMNKYKMLLSENKINFENAKKRQLVVLNALVSNGIISSSEKDEAYSEELNYIGELNQSKLENILYFRDSVLNELNSIKSIPKSLIETGGIKIYTTLDEKAQERMDKLLENLDELDDVMNVYHNSENN